MKKTIKGLPDWKRHYGLLMIDKAVRLYPVSIVSHYKYGEISLHYADTLGIRYCSRQTKDYPIDERTNEEFINLVTLGIVELFLEGDCEIC